MAEQTKEDKDKIFSKDDVAAHNKDGDLWIIVEDKVYDMSSFQKLHPGGEKVLLGVAGTDASKKYRKFHGDAVLRRYDNLRIGKVEPSQKVSESKGFFGFFRSKS